MRTVLAFAALLAFALGAMGMAANPTDPAWPATLRCSKGGFLVGSAPDLAANSMRLDVRIEARHPRCPGRFVDARIAQMIGNGAAGMPVQIVTRRTVSGCAEEVDGRLEMRSGDATLSVDPVSGRGATWHEAAELPHRFRCGVR